MPRLRNSATGVVVDVSEDLAGRLGGYVLVEEEATTAKPVRAKRATTTDDK